MANAKKVARQINSLTTSSIIDIWKERKLHREKKQPKQKLTKQTYLQQAKALAGQGMLPGHGGNGTMSYGDFLELPMRHRNNKVKKVLP